MKSFKLFSKFSSLRPNILKYEVTETVSLEGVTMAACGIKCIDLTIETIKILGVHFSYNQNLQIRKNFLKSITNMQNVLNLWRLRKTILEGKVIIFKTLALSKIVYLTLITSFSEQLKKYKKYKKPSFGTTSLPKSNMKLSVTLLKKVVSKMLT